MSFDELTKRWEAAIMPTYGIPGVALARGEGCRVWDVEGARYLDLIAGIAVCSLGHAHPALVDAINQQIRTLGHVSNLYLTEPAVALAERLLGLLGRDGRAFFCNSGAEANEAALKLARKHGRATGGDAKTTIVAAHGGFHGRTFGALAVTGQPAKQAPFEPLGQSVRFVPYADVDALLAAVDDDTAAIILEPMLGEGGVIPAPPGYLLAARQLASEHAALLIVDEVQTGIGRTGAWFAHAEQGLTGELTPDVVTLAKGLGGGFPIGACIALGDAAFVLAKGDHGSTFGGNPLACAAALAVIDTIEKDDLITNVKVVGDALAQRAASQVPVRGAGLLRALVLDEPIAAGFENASRAAGFLVNAVAPNAVRLAPPLILSEAEAVEFTDALPHILDQARAAVSVES